MIDFRWAAITAVAIATTCATVATRLDAQQGPTPQQQLAACTARLSDANAQASEAQKFMAAAQGGELVRVATIVAAFEKANPGKTLDAKLLVIDKARPEAAAKPPTK